MNIQAISLLLTFLLSVIPPFLHSQPLDFRYETITVDQGLSQSSVWCSMQDSQGFLWFGTADGLNRYDGYNFQVFRHDAGDSTSLSNNTVWSLLEDRTGKIWVGTLGGVDLYDRKSGTFTHLANHEPYRNTPLGSYTRSMLVDHKGIIWFGTADGVAMFDPANGALRQLPDSEFPQPSSKPMVVLLHEDDRGNIWMSRDERLFRYDRNTGGIINVPVGPDGGRLKAFASTRDIRGNYWFATTSNGVWSLDPATSQWTSYRHDPGNPFSVCDDKFRAVGQDHDGRIWFGAITNGVCYYDPATKKFYSFRPTDPRSKNARYEGVASILRDRSGLIWIGYDGGGLVKVNPNRSKFNHVLLPPSGMDATGDNFFKALMVDHLGDVWLGTYDQGISVLNRSTGVVRRYRHTPANPASIRSNTVLSLLEDRSGNVWVGMVNGLDLFDRRTERFRHLDLTVYAESDRRGNVVTDLCEDSMGTIWCGTITHLLKFDEALGKMKAVVSMGDLNVQPIMPSVTDIVPSPHGGLWVATLGGGLLKLRADGTVERILKRTSGMTNTISHNNVKTIAIDASGILWVGTEEGLHRYDPVKDQWRVYRVKDGLPNDFIYGVLLDERQHLWISTNRGISRMDISDYEHPKFRNYSPDDGLQSYEFNTNVYFKTPQGEMFFGGVNGFNAFFPDSVADNPVVPSIVLTGFKKFDEPFDPGGDIGSLSEIRLDYTESVFSFDFAALEFTNPARNQYAYRMEGFGKDWVYSSDHREARYTNLDPGTYTFRVKGSNNDGVWNESGTSIKVVIVPPFWKTWWFLGLVVLAGVSTFGGTVRFISTQKLKKRIRELEREKAIQDERQRTRERIARDLHDDLASTVGSAGFFVESVKHQLPDVPSQTKEFLDKTSSLLTEAEQAMSDIVWSVSPQHDTLESLLLRIRLTTADVCKASGMKYEIEIDPESPPLDLSQDVRRNIYLVFKEAIANAARHSGAGLVRVGAKTNDGALTLTICDDGKGLPPQPAGQTKRGHGLRNMQHRAEEIGADFSIDTSGGKGTTVRLVMRMTQSGH